MCVRREVNEHCDSFDSPYGCSEVKNCYLNQYNTECQLSLKKIFLNKIFKKRTVI